MSAVTDRPLHSLRITYAPKGRLVMENAGVVRNVVDSPMVGNPSIECHVAWMSDSTLSRQGGVIHRRRGP
jgi:hypothetical protein